MCFLGWGARARARSSERTSGGSLRGHAVNELRTGVIAVRISNRVNSRRAMLGAMGKDGPTEAGDDHAGVARGEVANEGLVADACGHCARCGGGGQTSGRRRRSRVIVRVEVSGGSAR